MFFVLLAMQIVFYASAVLKCNSSIAYAILYGVLGLAVSAFMFVYYTSRNFVYNNLVTTNYTEQSATLMLSSTSSIAYFASGSGTNSKKKDNSSWDCGALDCGALDCFDLDCADSVLHHLDCGGIDCDCTP